MRQLVRLLLLLALAFPGLAVAQDFNLPGLGRDASQYMQEMQRRFPAGASPQQRSAAEQRALQAESRSDWAAAATAWEERIGMGGQISGDQWLALARAQLNRQPPQNPRALQAAWRAFLAGLGLFPLAAAVLAARSAGPEPAPGESPRPAVLREVLANPAFWVLTAQLSLIVGASFGPFAMLPLFLHEVRGLPLAEAGALLAGSRLAGPAMVLAAGLLVDRVGEGRVAAASLAFTGVMTLALGLAQGWPLKAAVLLQPALSVLFFPAGFTAAARIFPERVRNVAISLIVPVAVLVGSGLTPLLLGWAGDRGRFGLGFALLGLAVLGGLALLRLTPFPAAHRRGPNAC